MGTYVIREMEHAMKGGITCWKSFIFVLVVITRLYNNTSGISKNDNIYFKKFKLDYNLKFKLLRACSATEILTNFDSN